MIQAIDMDGSASREQSRAEQGQDLGEEHGSGLVYHIVTGHALDDNMIARLQGFGPHTEPSHNLGCP